MTTAVGGALTAIGSLPPGDCGEEEEEEIEEEEIEEEESASSLLSSLSLMNL